MNIFNIGKHIYSAISRGYDMSGNIFPLIAPAGSELHLPICLYRRLSYQRYNANKDMELASAVYEISIIVSDSYAESVKLASNALKNLMEYKHEEIDHIELVNTQELYNENCYIQVMQVRFYLNEVEEKKD